MAAWPLVPIAGGTVPEASRVLLRFLSSRGLEDFESLKLVFVDGSEYFDRNAGIEYSDSRSRGYPSKTPLSKSDNFFRSKSDNFFGCPSCGIVADEVSANMVLRRIYKSV